nr:MAG TPA: hypothetical protein [Caudoviricetes sp.]
MIFNTTLAGGTKKWRRPCLKFSSKDGFGFSMGISDLSGKMEASQDGIHWRQLNNDYLLAKPDATTQTYNLYLSGTGNTMLGSPWLSFDAAALVDCSGYIETLLDWETVAIGEVPTMGEGCFQGFFSSITNFRNILQSAPSFLATDLSEACYLNMFVNCENLVTLPKLPASVIPQIAYSQMFTGCSKIMLSETQSDDYPTPYRIPFAKDVEDVGSGALTDMFAGTGGTFTGTPEPNTTYYLHKSCKIV